MGKTSPLQRSLKLLRAEGYTCAIVERWNPYAKIRQDMFGFADILAIHPAKREILAVQTTTAGHIREREQKILNLPMSATWLRAGGLIHVHGWKKTKKEGWTCKSIKIGEVLEIQSNDGQTVAVAELRQFVGQPQAGTVAK